MSDLIAIAYPNTTAAENALAELGKLQKQMLIKLDDAVIVERRDDGKVKLHQGSNAAVGAAGGALWGGLIGLIFFAPFLGMALGAAGGAIAGKVTDTGVDDNFLKSLGESLGQGHAALVLLVRDITIDKVVQQMHGQFGGSLIQSSLSAEAEDRLKAAVASAKVHEYA